jgi:hypothetical protein
VQCPSPAELRPITRAFAELDPSPASKASAAVRSVSIPLDFLLSFALIHMNLQNFALCSSCFRMESHTPAHSIRCMLDIVSIADELQCRGVRLVLDERSFGCESLVHPALAPTQVKRSRTPQPSFSAPTFLKQSVFSS